MTNDPVTLAYCAGIFDGEGYILIKKWIQKRKDVPWQYERYELHIGVNQVRPEAIQVLYKSLEGRMWFSSRGSGVAAKYSGRWTWEGDSKKGSLALQAMLPYLLLKKPEAEIAIAFQATKLAHGTGRSFKIGITQEEHDFRERCYLELKRLKRTHYEPETVELYEKLYAAHKVSRRAGSDLMGEKEPIGEERNIR